MAFPALKERTISIQNPDYEATAEEAVAYCPQCKALQTVWISENRLMPTRKFRQKGRQVFHDCGSNEPCRLYYSW